MEILIFLLLWSNIPFTLFMNTLPHEEFWRTHTHARHTRYNVYFLSTFRRYLKKYIPNFENNIKDLQFFTAIDSIWHNSKTQRLGFISSFPHVQSPVLFNWAIPSTILTYHMCINNQLSTWLIIVSLALKSFQYVIVEWLTWETMHF